ncbi:hypothetical protein OX283_013870 [Flavobacterium sp. SUN052]|uniref:hypothetical protein n=1 Tax=Flavobacterium sp. SUN052 TaxID=3002441 RepID=UPI00237E4836|nr:hypothetical protein [Flavobacterium sp. SUN052]MEC4005754.1 hypothetical protein [Flavobacterium sp. SUN052]
MKKIIFTYLLILIVNLCFSQLKPGRYLIRLSENNKALYAENGNGLTLQETSNGSLNGQNFLWDVKAVRNQPGLFLIQKVSNLKCITFKLDTSRNQVFESTWMEAQKPLTNIATQSFQIVSVGNGNYTIQPNNGKDNDGYLAAKMGTMNVDGGILEFEYKNQASNPTTYTNTSNIYFKFYTAQQGESSVVVNQVTQPIKSPTVIVAPKSDNKLDIDFKTGGDNLDPKDFMEGLKITLKIKNKPDLVKENANEGKEWPNNSIRRVTINLPADVLCSDIYEIVFTRRPKNGSTNNMTAIVGDNWNLDKVTVTTRIKVDGKMKNGTMNWISPSGSNSPLYRFIYENRDNDINTGTSLTINTNNICPTQNTTSNTSNSATTNASLTCIFGTGGDNLEGGKDNNVNLKIKFKSSNKVLTLNNINDSAKWNNFTENTVVKSIPNSTEIDINDIKEVEIRHTGGGGMFADNWHVDKIKISITKNGQTKVLVDRVGAPIHMFTGDARIKSFIVE